MAATFRYFGTASMPERKEVTHDLERRYAAQEAAKAAKAAAKAEAKQTFHSEATAESQP